MSAGCNVQWDDAIPGTRRFFTADPWGNRIEVVGEEPIGPRPVDD
jgi:hypothetical protein